MMKGNHQHQHQNKKQQIGRRKKRGRPPKVEDPQRSPPPPPERDVRRSLRRRNVKYVFDLDDYYDEDELFADDEDQKLREKKLKNLLKLEDEERVDHAPVESSSDEESRKPRKKRRIDEEMDVDDDEDDVDNYNNGGDDDEEEVVRTKPKPKAAVGSPPGTPEEEAPSRNGTRMPEKKALELILDKLQKKDIYGVYAEPVDPEELPDYHDMIHNPMDFATVRNKLANGSYATFEQFESDVFLICSNAMLYNSPDTVYHKQARTIQELAKRKFHKIRLNIERSEKEIKYEQKIRCSSEKETKHEQKKEIKHEQKIRSNPSLKKQIKRSVSRIVQEPLGSDFSSGATLATPGDIQNVTNATQDVVSYKPASVDGLVEGNTFVNDNNIEKAEESLPGKGPLFRFGKKSVVNDENRRATYNISLAHPPATSESVLSTFEGETKQLVHVGLYSDHSYARSLSRFAATLGSVAWKVASKSIEQALPEGLKFGRGWVGEYEPLPTPSLMLENRNLKEPAFLAKVQPPDTRKVEKIPATLFSSTENLNRIPFFEQNLPFLGPTMIRPPPASIIASSVQVNEQPIRGNVSTMKPASPFFLSPGTRPPNVSYQPQNLQSGTFGESSERIQKQVQLNGRPSFYNNSQQNLQSRAFVESDQKIQNQVELNGPPTFSKSTHQNLQSRASVKSDKKMQNQVQLNGPPPFSKNTSDSINNRQISSSSEIETSRAVEFSSRNINFPTSGPFKRPESNGVAYTGLPGKKVIDDRVDSNPIANSSSDLAKPASYYSHDQNGQGLSDPVQLMKMLAEKAQNQQKPSNNDLNNNAAVAAARAWMSAGAGGFIRPPTTPENTNLNKNQIYADSLYNSSRDMQGQVSRFEKNGSSPHAFVPQGAMPMMIGNEMQFHQNPRMVFPQMVTADLSRFQMQSNWRNHSPQMHSRQKQESLPPDLNIGFQSSGSPGRPSSGVLGDSQHPDLALQL